MINTEIRLIIFFVSKDEEALHSQQKQDWELTVAQIMNSLLPNSDLKKEGKTTRPFRYNLNQIPYNYTVEMTVRVKELDLIECLMEVCDIVQEAGIKTIPKQKKCIKVVWGGLTNSWEKRRSYRQRRKGKIYPYEYRVAKNSKET